MWCQQFLECLRCWLSWVPEAPLALFHHIIKREVILNGSSLFYLLGISFFLLSLHFTCPTLKFQTELFGRGAHNWIHFTHIWILFLHFQLCGQQQKKEEEVELIKHEENNRKVNTQLSVSSNRNDYVHMCAKEDITSCLSFLCAFWLGSPPLTHVCCKNLESCVRGQCNSPPCLLEMDDDHLLISD